MDQEPIRFHEVHGTNICLSVDGTEAELENLGDGLCFTSRPLGRGDNVVLKMLSGLSASRGADIRVGVTKHDPVTMLCNLPSYLLTGLDRKNGFLGANLLAYEDNVQLDKEIEIYFAETTGNLMIRNVGSEPIELFPADATAEPLYLIFNLLESSRKVRIGGRCRSNPRLRPEIVRQQVTSERLSRPESGTSQDPILKPAYFTSILIGPVAALPQRAKSADASPARMNFAFVDTFLRPGCTLIVELTKLKRSEPVQIVLTAEDAHEAYSKGFLSKLCDTTYSLSMESKTPANGDELAIRISRKGAVYISHNDRGWHQRMHVDANLEYHVVFGMQHIAELTMLGIRIDREEVEETPSPAPEDTHKVTGGVSSDECIICLGNSRAVVLLPCFHFALCEACARSVQRANDAKCPVCRVHITDVKRIYAV